MGYAIGCDVSHWQDKDDTAKKIDFAQMKSAGASFVFIKSSQSTSADHRFKDSWSAAREAGLIRGAYHFLTFTKNASTQAEFMWSLLENDPGEMPPVCDFEAYGTVPSSAGDYLWGFCETIEKLSGRVPIIYTGAYFFQQYVKKNPTAYTRFPLWIAAYTTEAGMEKLMQRTPWEDWTFWQYTEKGDGLAYGAESKQIDLNYFNGNFNALLERFNITQVQKENVVALTDAEKLTKLWNAHPELWD